MKDPWRELAAAIIKQAIDDWKKFKLTGQRVELIEFFNSGWFEGLAELSCTDAVFIREKLKIPEKEVSHY